MFKDNHDNDGWESNWEWELGGGDNESQLSPLLQSESEQPGPSGPYKESIELLPSRHSSHSGTELSRALPKRIKLLLKIFTVLLLASTLIHFIHWHPVTIPPRLPPTVADMDVVQNPSNKLEPLPIPTEECTIPQVPIKSNAYLHAARGNNTLGISQCGDSSQFTKFINSSTLALLEPEKYDRKQCIISEIERPFTFVSDDKYQLKSTKTFNEVNQAHSIEAEHVIISCINVNGETKYDYHSRVNMEQGFLPSKRKYWNTKPKDQVPVNVMVLVLDSTSAADAFRQLPKTMKYLLEDLNFVYFSRFQALGEPTFLNAIPLLTGQSTVNFFKSKDWYDRWDETEFIWKQFSRSNFATAYMEDIPEMGTFNYGGQPGFIHQPTDFYPRSFFTAWTELGGRMPDNCLGTNPIWKYLYKYQLDMLRKLNNIIPSFTMPWLCWPFHDIFDTLGALEPATLEFFQAIGEAKDILENTVIIVMGDHGFYTGEYAETDEGLIERRLPLFIMRVPKHITKFVPNAESIIEQNSKQVTSHYDVFKTLQFLSQLGQEEPAIPQSSKTGPGRHLFQPLPKNRNCEDAGIPSQWCACNLREPSSVYDLENRMPSKSRQSSLRLYPVEQYVDRSRRRNKN